MAEMKSKVLMAALSLAISIALWIFVVTVVSPESEATYYNVPVIYQGESVLNDERHLMVISGMEETVTLRLSGNRTDLNKLSSSNITVTADLSRIYEPGEVNLNLNVTYPGDVPNTAIAVQSRNPEKLSLVIEERLVKAVDVVVEYTGNSSEEYVVDKDNIEMDVSAVTIAGPKSVVDKITQAKIEINQDNLTQTITDEFVYTLCDEKGNPVDAKMVTTDVSGINVILPVFCLKELPIEIELIEGGGATKDNTTVTPSVQTIWVSGTQAQLKDLQSIVLGPVDLSELTEEVNTVTVPVKLPEGLNVESGETEIQVQISFTDLSTKTLVLTAFKAENVPSGLEVDWVNQTLEVVVRGKKSEIDRITEKSVTVLVDFSDEQVGSVNKIAKFQFSDAYANVGAIGNYSVKAVLVQKNR